MGLPVVLAHGMRTSRTMWRAQVDALTAAGRRVEAIDLPGHGRRAGERFTLDGAVEALSDAVDGLGGRALVVGLSLGGYVAITHAARYPAQVAGLVAAACSTPPARPIVDGWVLAARGIARLPDAGAGLNQVLVDHTLNPAAAVDVAAGGFAFDVVVDSLRAVRGLDPVADLACIQVPVWLVNGRYDHFRGQERRYLAACQDGHLVVVPGAKHLVSLDAPVAFNRILFEALDRAEQDEPPPPASPDPRPRAASLECGEAAPSQMV
ncbi:alpha/beta fold hydrolase [Pengzhenrongella frigida]|uniref:Alpha/beta hydrolase n=1 Tax=Pengzhenrongella frigida TaxID=1259133 RepID=A0A4V1ZH71_9MICO|nr:alpha/beta hydrolase [Cellulomonas sp. HLT2-17]RYV51024.1 alpha/beta hydrolase [Cellulomonas sp. HLT2-17]